MARYLGEKWKPAGLPPVHQMYAFIARKEAQATPVGRKFFMFSQNPPLTATGV
jgi:hypothetical protein